MSDGNDLHFRCIAVTDRGTRLKRRTSPLRAHPQDSHASLELRRFLGSKFDGPLPANSPTTFMSAPTGLRLSACFLREGLEQVEEVATGLSAGRSG